MKTWHKLKPELFKKQPYYLTGGDKVLVTKNGEFINEGFGGYLFQRNPIDSNGNFFSSPQPGQAKYDGDYVGFQVFQGQGCINFTKENLSLDLDFGTAQSLRFISYNRRVFDADGKDITRGFTKTSFGTENDELPGVISTSNIEKISNTGSILAKLQSFNPQNTELWETEVIVVFLAGEEAREVVGIVTLEGDFDTSNGITIKEIWRIYWRTLRLASNLTFLNIQG
jgi:hypothetical protein